VLLSIKYVAVRAEGVGGGVGSETEMRREKRRSKQVVVVLVEEEVVVMVERKVNSERICSTNYVSPASSAE
jgi:hypothetical protein